VVRVGSGSLEADAVDQGGDRVGLVILDHPVSVLDDLPHSQAKSLIDLRGRGGEAKGGQTDSRVRPFSPAMGA
jgi:hypothetical protein